MNLEESKRLGRRGTAARIHFEAALERLREAALEMEESGQEAILVGRTGSGERCHMPVGSRCRVEYRPSRNRHR